MQLLLNQKNFDRLIWLIYFIQVILMSGMFFLQNDTGRLLLTPANCQECIEEGRLKLSPIHGQRENNGAPIISVKYKEREFVCSICLLLLFQPFALSFQ